MNDLLFTNFLVLPLCFKLEIVRNRKSKNLTGIALLCCLVGSTIELGTWIYRNNSFMWPKGSFRAWRVSLTLSFDAAYMKYKILCKDNQIWSYDEHIGYEYSCYYRNSVEFRQKIVSFSLDSWNIKIYPIIAVVVYVKTTHLPCSILLMMSSPSFWIYLCGQLTH